MKNPLLSLLTLIAFGVNGQLQQGANLLTQGGVGQQEECRANHRHEHLMQTDPAYVQRRNKIEADYQNVLRNGLVNKTTYTIPVVVHVIHTGQAVGTGVNITDAQIQSAIDNLNDAYSNTSTAFTTYTGSNTNIQFCLAQRDASGNPTTGIVRVNGSGVTDYSTKGICDAGGGTGTDNEQAVKALSKWDNTKYYNFWIVSEINDNGGGSGTQGYAYFPGAGSAVDGAVMLYNAFGYDPDGSLTYNLKNYTNKNVTAVHEMGHALNLYHTFQGDGSGSTCPSDAVCGTSGDCVSDTPPHKRSNSDCLINTNDATCGNVDRDLHVHNFMDYSSDDCQTEFTAGQITRMNAVMTGTRASLASSDGCNPVYTTDAGVNSIITPNSSTCGTTFTPQVRIKNYGSGTLTSFTINYDIDGGTNQTQNWTGTLTSGSTVDVTLSAMTTTTGSHTFNASTSSPNGTTDEYAANDDKDYSFTIIGDPPAAASCSPTTTNTGNHGTGIDRVQFNTLDHAHTDNNNDGLQDFTCLHNTTVSTNTAYTLTVTTQDNEYVIAYIDYDDDGNFEAGELVLDHHNTNSGTSHSVSVTIPQYPEVTGKLIRMRIKSNFNTMTTNACTDSDYGEFEDYSVFITTPPCVAPVINTHPSALMGCSPVTGSFACSVTGPSLSYQWQVNTGSGFTNISNGGVYSGATTATLTLTGADGTYNGNDYRCYISNPCGNVTTYAAEFKTLSAPTAMCTPVSTNNGNFGNTVSSVSFNGMVQTSSTLTNAGYTNNMCNKNTAVTAGSTYSLSITLNSGGSGSGENLEVYIDYDNDGVLDAGEQVLTGSLGLNSSNTFSTNVVIPTNAVENTMLRMRVFADCSGISENDKICSSSLFIGDVEDYGVVIQSTPVVVSSTPGSSCGTGTVNISATAGSGYISWYDASTGGNLLGTGNTYTTPSISATTTYYAEAVNGALVSSARTAVTATITTPSQVQASQQGTTLTTLGQAIIADAVAGATHYRFEVTENGNTEVIDRTVRWFYLANLSSYDYSKTYSIRVATQVGGIYSCYGTAYNVSSPAVPTTQITSSQCGATIPTLFNSIQADQLSGATKYRFEVSSSHGTQIITNTTPYFYLTQLSTYTYGTAYTIRVAIEYNGTFGAYGNSCVVKSPSVTTLQASQCNNSVLQTANTAIIANEVSSATGYKFEVTIDGVTEVLTRTVRWFYLSNLSSYGMNKQLKVRVAVQKDGVWGPFYTACYIKTPAAWLAQDENIYEADQDLITDIGLETYPNPNSGDFTVVSTHEGRFSVLNELGQLMQTVEITKEGNFEARIEGLESGVYFVTGRVNNEIITKKVMIIK